MKNRIKFIKNIALPSALAVILFIVNLFFIVIPYFEDVLMDRKREMITELTNAALSILEKYHKDEVEGFISGEEAQKTAVSRIQYLRYGDENKDYFWITDMQPVMIAHPYRPELIGESLLDYEDSHGKKLFVASVETVMENNHGYIEYMWQWKDDSTHIVPKLSYVHGFEPWGWIIGTGIYIEDVKEEIAGLTRKFTWFSVSISLVIALILFYISNQSYNIELKRQKAEKELHQSREKYRSLVEASTEGLIMYMDKQISFVNHVFEKMTGISASDVTNKNVTDIIEIPDDIKKKIEAGEYDFKQITTESKLLPEGDKEPLDIIINIVPIVFYNKDAVIFSIKDVSSDKLIEEELSFTREKFKSLMDKLNMGLFRTSMDKKGKFLEVNETGLKILGVKSFDQISNSYILDFFAEQNDRKTFRENLVEKGFIKNRIVKLKRKDGQLVVVSVSLAVIYDEKGEPRYCDGLIEDVTRRSMQEHKPTFLNDNYTAFSQLLYQPAGNFARNILYCDYNSPVSQVAETMSDLKQKISLVRASGGEILGFIDDERIRKSLSKLKEDNNVDLLAYQIMQAPVPAASADTMIIEASLLMKRHNSSFLALKNNRNEFEGIIKENDLLLLQEFLPVKLIMSVKMAKTVDEIKRIRLQYVNSLIPVIENNTNSVIVFKCLSLIADLICEKIIEMAINEVGKPPVSFAFINLGSEGRKEQTLKTDQDNALIYSESEHERADDVKMYFDRLSKIICTNLDKAGYEFCKGDIMAMNPDWCQPVSVWKQYFEKWINNGKAQDLLEISIFFDFRFVYGEEELADDLKDHVLMQSKKNPVYLHQLAQNTLTLKPQVGFWGNILLETAGAPPETVDIKKTIMPIVSFARIYALKNGLSLQNTAERLNKLRDNEELPSQITNDIIQALDYLAIIRLKRQAALISQNDTPDNHINTKTLSDFDRTIIKKVLSIINNMLSKLSYDFKGSV